jgi:uncharacterized protein YbjT (DUF2867 family)
MMNTNSTQGKILVTGATGNVGGAVAMELVSRGVSVRALVRDESRAVGLAGAGVEIVVGDMDVPETLDAALSGVRAVFLATSANPNSTAQVRRVIDAALRADKPHVVRLGAAAPAADGPILGRMHAESDSDLAGSGLPYTLLRPSSFMQNAMMAAPSVISEGAIYMPFKNGRLGLIDVRDLAECAVIALTGDGHEGKTYTLTGPDSISYYDVASALSDAIGKEVKYIDIPLEACREALTGMGLDGWTANAYVEYFDLFGRNGYDFTTDEVEELTGRTPRSISQFAADFAGAFGAETADLGA